MHLWVQTKFILQAKVGNEEEFKISLQKLRGADADIYEEVAEIQVFLKSLHHFNIILNVCFF